MQISADTHEQTAELFKAVADPTRVRILGLLLAAGELCVCEVETALDLSQSRTSRALSQLRRAGLVVDRRDGAWVHYSASKDRDPVVRGVLQGLRRTLADDPAALADLANLERSSCR
ncbi:MAG: metalloregulator ArsR/SmtB family transcription factor [Planctomycetota bacterium]